MSWSYVLGPIALVTFIWMLTRPVRRDVRRSDFDHWFREVLINSKTGAWLEITDVDRNVSFTVRKLDRRGRQISIKIAAAAGRDSQEAVRSMRHAWEGAELTPCSDASEDAAVILRALLESSDAVGDVAAAAVRFFDAAGSAPGCLFRLRAKGRTDPEAIRPLVDSMQHPTRGKKPRVWGKALGKALDRHRDRK